MAKQSKPLEEIKPEFRVEYRRKGDTLPFRVECCDRILEAKDIAEYMLRNGAHDVQIVRQKGFINGKPIRQRCKKVVEDGETKFVYEPITTYDKTGGTMALFN